MGVETAQRRSVSKVVNRIFRTFDAAA